MRGVVTKDPASREGMVPEGAIRNTLYKKDFWNEENLKYGRPHYRLEKSARIIIGSREEKNARFLMLVAGPQP